MKKPNWYTDNKIELILNDSVVEIDKNSKEVKTQSGIAISYDKLLIATGANAFIPPITGSDKKDVFTIRKIKDACNCNRNSNKHSTNTCE